MWIVRIKVEECENCTRLTHSPACSAKWCCWCGAKLTGCWAEFAMVVDDEHVFKVEKEGE